MSAQPLIPIPPFDERVDWIPWDALDFLHRDLCGDSELGPWMNVPAAAGTWGKMFWDYDALVVCQACKDAEKHGVRIKRL